MIVILGGGESGTGAALLAKAQGLPCFVSDFGQLEPEARRKLTEAGIPFEEGGHDLERVARARKVVKSPGIPPKAPAVQAALQAGIPVIDELEFAYPYMRGKAICITGSNGKTTTTLLTYHLLLEAGVSVGLAGNVGKSLAGQLAEGVQPDWWVIETSSFQLDGWVDFRPAVSMLLNITPDHLDRYGSMQAYAASKISITKNQTPEDVFIYMTDGDWVERMVAETDPAPSRLPFNLNHTDGLAAWHNAETLHFHALGKEMALPLAGLPLKGLHNQLNMMAAGLAGLATGLVPEDLLPGFRSFINAPHRLEKVATLHGVEYVNDSKATNPDSVRYALEAVDHPVIWIAGGKDKGNDYSLLEDLVRSRVKALICLTKYPEPLLNAFSDIIPNIQVTESVTEAVQLAQRMASPGEVVLLSPACASFDLFKNYEDRGEQFRNAVLALA